ncbi:MAG: flippase-like domain-containing protein [Nitrospirae bacterium]|nr:flippase-like domain-containing protein [Nitrospirota bacterium]
MRRLLTFSLKLLISGGLLYFLFSRIDSAAVLKTLKDVDLSIFFVAFLLYLSTVFLATKRWSLFLPEAIPLSKLLSLYFIGSFFNTFLPGLVGGDAVKAYYLYKHTGRGGSSVASVFMDRYLGFSALIGIGLIAFVFGYSYIMGTQVWWTVPGLAAIFILMSFLFWRLNWGKIKALTSFYNPIMGYKANRKIIYKGLMWSVGVQGIGILGIYILSLALGLKTSIIYFCLFIPVITAISTIPISLSGLGIREAGFAILFTQVGFTTASAISLSLLWFIAACLVHFIGGIEYLRVGKPPKC